MSMEETNLSNSISTLEATNTSDIDSLLNDDIETINRADINDTTEKLGYLKLPHGQALTLDEIYNITSSKQYKVIVFIGPADSGKTTIETAIYQLFQREPFCNMFFADSLTLNGYEERSFYTRLISKNKTSNTLRTSRFEDKIFLHMNLLDFNTSKKTNYLFADISGEVIFSHKGNVESIKTDMPYLAITDDYTFLLDGSYLADKLRINGSIDAMRTMARTIFDANLYSSKTRVQIVISKYDIIGLLDDEELKSNIDKKIQTLVDVVKKYVSTVSVHKVAAMPQKEGFDVGFGIDKLFKVWCAEPSKISVSSPSFPYEQLTSEFNKLSYKFKGGDSYE